MTDHPLSELLELSDSGVWGDEDQTSGISVLRSTNFNANGTLDLSKLTFRALEPRNRERKLLRPGDILLEKSGGGPKQPVGRVCLFKGADIPHSFGNFIARLRPREGVLSEYLFYFLWQFHASGKTSHYQKQTTGIRNLELPRFLSIQVPLVSLDEQRRIVDLLARAEGIVRLRREAQKKAQAIIPALFLNMFGDPATNPRGYKTSKLGELARIVGGSSLPAGEPFAGQEDGLMLLKVGDMNLPGNEILFNTSKEWVPDERRTYSSLGKQAIVFPKRGAAIATNKKRLTTRASLLDPNLMGIEPDAAVARPVFLYHWFCQFDLATITNGSTVPQLNKGDLTPLSVFLPPLELQLGFEQRVEMCLAVGEQQALATAKAEATFSALLARTFSESGLIAGPQSAAEEVAA